MTSDNFVDRRHDARRARDRRDRLHERPVDAAREGDLHRRRPALPGGAVRLRQPQGVRARGRVRLLHRRDHVHEGDDSRHVRGRRSGAVRSGGRRGAWRRVADIAALAAGIDDRDQVEARLGRAWTEAPGARRAPRRRAPAPASHGEVHVVSRVVGFKKIKFYTNENVGSGELDLPEQQMHTTSYWLTIPTRADGGAAVRHGRSARRRARPGVRDAQRRAAAADVRRPRPRAVDRRHRASKARTRLGGSARAAGAAGTVGRADDLPLRQLSGRHRLQRAAVRACTTRCSRARAS